MALLAQQPMSQPKISPLNLHNNAEPEQVMAGKKPKQYVKGQTYAINYKNGVSLEIVWDGKFFKPKGQCNLAGQVAGSTPQTVVVSPGEPMMAGSQVEQSPGFGVRTQSPLVERGSQPSSQSPSTGPHHPAPGSAPMALSPVCSQRVSSSSDTNSSKPASPAQQPMSQPKISPLNLHNNAEPEQVMAGKQPGQYVKGQTYAIKYNNGVSLEVIWDGKFFKPKGQCNLAGQVAGSTLQTVVASPGKRDQLSPPATPGTEPPGCLTPGPQTPGASQGDPSGASPAQTGGAMPGATPGMTAAILDAAGQVRGGGGGDKQLQRKVLRGNVTGLNMAGRAQGAPPTNSSMVNGTRKWTHSSVGKDKLSRPPLHPEKQADNEPPKPPRIRKPTEEGKFAVCNHCGNISVDYNDCESCHKPIPDDPKYYYPSQQDKKEAPKSAASPLIATTIPNTIPNTVVYTIQTMPTKADGTLLTKGKFYGKKAATMQIVPPIRTLRATKRRGGATAARGAKRKYVRRVAEPETVTILSSDDEEPARASTSTPTTPGQDTNQPNTPNMAANSTPSATQSRRFKMEDSSGKIVMPLQQSASTPSPTERVLPAMGAQDTAYLQNTRSVKLGSLRTVAPRGVHFTPQGICMGLVPEGEEEKTSPVQVALAVDELVHIQVNFGRQFPLMGIYVNPKCAHRLRTKFNMSDKGPFFDPCSNDDSQKRIIILTSEFPKEFIDKVKGLCEHYQAKNQCCTQPLLEEISNQAANNLMMTSAPKAIVNSIKEQQGNIVSRTKTTTQTHTVVGQLVINTQGNNQMTLITTIPVNTEHRDLNEDEEDDEPVDRSRSPSPILNVFSGPIIKLFTFPPPPSTGGITVTNEDLFCLQEGEFLNDVIIDFYLKYLFTKMLSPEDQARTHVFSSFFYRRLTQKDNKRRMGEETLKLTQQERRHHRVRTWTRHVDLFSKDFIIVPINESAHWYLAIVCFPYLKEPVVFKKTMAVQTRVPESVTKSAASKPSSSQSDAEKAFLSDLKGIKEGEPAASVDSSANKVADKKGNAETPSKPKTVMSKIVVSGIEKQPCILVFDSLSGPSRSCVVRTLREYLQVEWDIKKAAKEGSRVFDKDTVKGANPKCPQQTNYSDCGVYVLEYVESFFKRPITDYAIPIRTLADWFTEEQVAAKRQELRDLILKLQKVLNPHLDFEPPPQHVFLSDQQGAALNPQTDLMDHTPIEHTTLKEELPPLKEELSPKEDL